MSGTYKLPPLPIEVKNITIEKRMSRDISHLGSKGINIVRDIGVSLKSDLIGCIHCGKCTSECPEEALSISSKTEGQSKRSSGRSYARERRAVDASKPVPAKR